MFTDASFLASLRFSGSPVLRFSGSPVLRFSGSPVLHVNFGLSRQLLIEFILLAISMLFVIIDPLALVPVFLAMTP
ncbi:MAG: hypothetical protein H0W78_02390 [Planctomycetes bacterium]|nr:hypothetical protein [Planctomycetota bacterium]